MAPATPLGLPRHGGGEGTVGDSVPQTRYDASPCRGDMGGVEPLAMSVELMRRLGSSGPGRAEVGEAGF